MNDSTTGAAANMSGIRVRDYTGKMQLMTMTDISDIETLRGSGLIGAQLKKGIIQGHVIAFTSKMGMGAVCVRLVGDRVKARLLAPCPALTDHDAAVLMTNAARTTYSTYPVDVDLTPLYSADELGRVEYV